MKGQAALEFLTTYGWAFLVILVMIGALTYFGVLAPAKFHDSAKEVCVKYCQDIVDDIKNATDREQVGKLLIEFERQGCDQATDNKCISWRNKNTCELAPDTEGCICDLYERSEVCNTFDQDLTSYKVDCNEKIEKCVKAHAATCLQWEQQPKINETVISDDVINTSLWNYDGSTPLCPKGTTRRQVRCDCCKDPNKPCCMAYCFICVALGAENFT